MVHLSVEEPPFVIFPFAEIEASNTLEKRQLKSKFW